MWRWKGLGLTLQILLRRYGNNKYSPTIGKLIGVKSGSLASGSSRKKRTKKKKTHTERISFPSKLILGVNQKVIIESEYHFCQIKHY